MNKHLALLCMLATALVAGCFGGGGDGFNPSEAEVRRVVTENLARISIDICSEDVHEAEGFIHDSFVLQPEVAARFNVGPFEGMGKAAFRSFFERVVEKYGDISLTFTVNQIDVEGNLASAHVTVSFSGNNTDAIPPVELNFTENDLFVFEYNGDTYALINWGEDPNPGGHNQGNGGNL
ncbi:MAG: nuclear transport factor 2 family protein [bacterium]|nr:nuclear transport factor 2 family protein [bacterium]